MMRDALLRSTKKLQMPKRLLHVASHHKAYLSESHEEGQQNKLLENAFQYYEHPATSNVAAN